MIFYGLSHPAQIRQHARAVCDVLGHGKTHQAITMLLRTCAQETGMGTVRDRYDYRHGIGLMQTEDAFFDDRRNRTPEKHLVAIKQRFDIDWREIEPRDLAFGPLLSMIDARLHYLLIPEPFPDTLEEQAKYYKRYYNTYAGAATPEQFIGNAKRYGLG